MSALESLFGRDPRKDENYLDYVEKYRGGNILHFCIKENDFLFFKKVIQEEHLISKLLDSKIIDSPDFNKVYPIQLAILNQRKQMVNFLIKNKCNLYVQDLEGKNIYHYCLMSNYKNTKIKPTSKFLLCKINVEETLIYVTDFLTDNCLDLIKQELDALNTRNLKLYFHKDLTTKSIFSHLKKNNIAPKILIGEHESLSNNSEFIKTI